MCIIFLQVHGELIELVPSEHLAAEITLNRKWPFWARSASKYFFDRFLPKGQILLLPVSIMIAQTVLFWPFYKKSQRYKFLDSRTSHSCCCVVLKSVKVKVELPEREKYFRIISMF